MGYDGDGNPIYSDDCAPIPESREPSGDAPDYGSRPQPQCSFGQFFDPRVGRCVWWWEDNPAGEDGLCYDERGVPYEADPWLGCYKDSSDGKGGYAVGGYVKKERVRKYQMGGIADLPRIGGARNPADGYNFGFAQGGIAPMPEYQAGGKLLRGPGDGMSDDIPAVIRGKGVQRAALADGEFVIPADVVSHLGNGSTEAGAKKLYQMMALIRKARTGKSKQAPQVNVDKFLPVPSRKKSRR
jgi:hypothetical protein